MRFGPFRAHRNVSSGFGTNTQITLQLHLKFDTTFWANKVTPSDQPIFAPTMYIAENGCLNYFSVTLYQQHTVCNLHVFKLSSITILLPNKNVLIFILFPAPIL